MGKWISVMKQLRQFLVFILLQLTVCDFSLAQSNMMLQALMGAGGACYPMDSSWTPSWANVVGLWHLEETASGTAPSGTDFTDSSGNLNYGTKIGALTFGSTSRIGKSPTFANATGITIPNTASLQVSSLTISAWIQPSSVGSKVAIVNKANGCQAWGIELLAANTINFFAFWGNGGVGGTGSNTVLTANKWYHIATTFDAATTLMKVYINGVFETSTTNAGKTLDNASVGALMIGDRNAGCTLIGMPGLIDEVGIWNVALTAQQIKLIYDQQSCGKN
jgi:hypothetical protein